MWDGDARLHSLLGRAGLHGLQLGSEPGPIGQLVRLRHELRQRLVELRDLRHGHGHMQKAIFQP